MGCKNSTSAKVEDTYAAPEEGLKEDGTTKPLPGQENVPNTQSSYISGKEDSSKDLKSNAKDDSDWVPTIDTDILNEAGGGRIVAEDKVVDNTAQVSV
jgi:hypothetical protein|eukprot:g2494.t1